MCEQLNAGAVIEPTGVSFIVIFSSLGMTLLLFPPVLLLLVNILIGIIVFALELRLRHTRETLLSTDRDQTHRTLVMCGALFEAEPH